MKRPRRLVIALALGCAGLAGLVAVRGAFARSSLSGPAAEVIPPHQRANRRPPPAPGAAVLPAPVVDLLDRIDVDKDALVDDWGFQDRALIIPWTRFSRLQVPCHPPEEYDLRLKVTRKNGLGALILGFVYRGRQGVVSLDTGGDGAAQLTLDAESPPILVAKTMLFRRNVPTDVLVSVRKDRLAISAAGRSVFEWNGDPEDLADAYRYRIPDGRALMLAAQETTYRIEEMHLLPVTGSPEFSR